MPAVVPTGSIVTGVAAGQSVRRLLVVEDDPSSRLLLGQVLDFEGFELQEANDGQAGVELFESWHPHLVWMDIRMAVMDGKAAARRIRSMPGGKDVKIIALTAYALESERLEILAAGFDGFIRKPFRETEIYQALTQHLGVQFTYRASEYRQAACLDTPDAEALRAVPPGLLHALGEAAERLDGPLCAAAITKIAALDGGLAASLSVMVDKMKFSDLLEMLDPLLEEGGRNAGT